MLQFNVWLLMLMRACVACLLRPFSPGAQLERIWGPGDGRPVKEMKVREGGQEHRTCLSVCLSICMHDVHWTVLLHCCVSVPIELNGIIIATLGADRCDEMMCVCFCCCPAVLLLLAQVAVDLLVQEYVLSGDLEEACRCVCVLCVCEWLTD
jgi:hypothetical protein